MYKEKGCKELMNSHRVRIISKANCKIGVGQILKMCEFKVQMPKEMDIYLSLFIKKESGFIKAYVLKFNRFDNF